MAAPIHPADKGDTATLDPTLEEAQKSLSALGLAPTFEEPCELVADKGYHSREGLKGLDGGVWKTRIAEPKPSNGYLRWHGDEAAPAGRLCQPIPVEIRGRARGPAHARGNEQDRDARCSRTPLSNR